MNRADLAWTASLAASRVIREQGVLTLPVDPMAIARVGAVRLDGALRVLDSAAACGVGGTLR